MQIYYGRTGLGHTQQEDFSETLRCPCGGQAIIAFVAKEGSNESVYVCDLHRNDLKNVMGWPHDACSFAVYICRKCMMAVTVWNQG